MKTLDQAKEYIEEHWHEGVICPCCEGYVRLYRRKLNSNMARSLIKLYLATETTGSEWIHSSAFGVEAIGGGDYGKLKFWGLIQLQANKDNPKKHTSGMWRITNSGINFVTRRTAEKKYCLIYNDTCYGFEGPVINIDEALGEHFNYSELMRGY